MSEAATRDRVGIITKTGKKFSVSVYENDKETNADFFLSEKAAINFACRMRIGRLEIRRASDTETHYKYSEGVTPEYVYSERVEREFRNETDARRTELDKELAGLKQAFINSCQGEYQEMQQEAMYLNRDHLNDILGSFHLYNINVDIEGLIHFEVLYRVAELRQKFLDKIKPKIKAWEKKVEAARKRYSDDWTKIENEKKARLEALKK